MSVSMDGERRWAGVVAMEDSAEVSTPVMLLGNCSR